MHVLCSLSVSLCSCFVSFCGCFVSLCSHPAFLRSCITPYLFLLYSVLCHFVSFCHCLAFFVAVLCLFVAILQQFEVCRFVVVLLYLRQVPLCSFVSLDLSFFFLEPFSIFVVGLHHFVVVLCHFPSLLTFQQSLYSKVLIQTSQTCVTLLLWQVGQEGHT